MSRKSEPPDEGDVLVRSSPSPPEPFGSHDQAEATGHGSEDLQAAARLEQVQRIRRFVHHHARALHVLSARLVGPRHAGTLAEETISELAGRVSLQSLAETRALAQAPARLWRLSCKLMACRAHEYLRTRDDSGLDRDGLERAHDALSPAERILYVFHYYYRFSDSDFESMFHLNKTQSQSLVYRALRKLKRAMRGQRAKQ